VKKIILCLIVIALIIVFAGCSGKVRINLNAPSAPDSLNPATGATDAETTITLTWSVSVDPKGGTVRYDLYMGTTNTPERVAQDLTENTYQVSGLQNSTTYYWQVVAKNETGDSSKSALNSLTTKDVSGPSTGKVIYQQQMTILMKSRLRLKILQKDIQFRNKRVELLNHR
jgi:hypothetical protein